eukprot:CAMPEP_0171122646 /NCGR_PEP_ID=MMETSP0766_2-20121228/105483_1 /TAXON_ID=439317 /ORGANISM="Gambierdiscus australes, Strain CAWD 149" /LENGTH=98 /DNA_ID=CAMNT_0011585493 /DNA_START=85 /DNA_END=378 /DNA_ORIENTATION=+
MRMSAGVLPAQAPSVTRARTSALASTNLFANSTLPSHWQMAWSTVRPRASRRLQSARARSKLSNITVRRSASSHSLATLVLSARKWRGVLEPKHRSCA